MYFYSGMTPEVYANASLGQREAWKWFMGFIHEQRQRRLDEAKQHGG